MQQLVQIPVCPSKNRHKQRDALQQNVT